MHETFEDVTVSDTFEFGAYEVTREEIITFAEQYDPQPFHTDPETAEESMFGSLVASGWHTAAMTMRMLVDNYLSDSGALGSPGLDGLRWTTPVKPGDVLGVEIEVTGKDVWDDDRGVVLAAVTTHTDDGETVMTMDSRLLFPRA